MPIITLEQKSTYIIYYFNTFAAITIKTNENES